MKNEGAHASRQEAANQRSQITPSYTWKKKASVRAKRHEKGATGCRNRTCDTRDRLTAEGRASRNKRPPSRFFFFFFFFFFFLLVFFAVSAPCFFFFHFSGLRTFPVSTWRSMLKKLMGLSVVCLDFSTLACTSKRSTRVEFETAWRQVRTAKKTSGTRRRSCLL